MRALALFVAMFAAACGGGAGGSAGSCAAALNADGGTGGALPSSEIKSQCAALCAGRVACEPDAGGVPCRTACEQVAPSLRADAVCVEATCNQCGGVCREGVATRVSQIAYQEACIPKLQACGAFDLTACDVESPRAVAKLYNDAAIARLTACLDRPCDQLTLCFIDAVGEDIQPF